jgi:hypothetical protein
VLAHSHKATLLSVAGDPYETSPTATQALPVRPMTSSFPDPIASVPTMVHGRHYPDRPLRPCVLVSPSWFGWFALLDTFKFLALECYCDLTCPWVHQATTLHATREWIAFSDFPLPSSPIFLSAPLYIIIHGPAFTLEFLPPRVFERHSVLFLSPTPTSALPFCVSISHCTAGAF